MAPAPVKLPPHDMFDLFPPPISTSLKAIGANVPLNVLLRITAHIIKWYHDVS